MWLGRNHEGMAGMARKNRDLGTSRDIGTMLVGTSVTKCHRLTCLHSRNLTHNSESLKSTINVSVRTFRRHKGRLHSRVFSVACRCPQAPPESHVNKRDLKFSLLLTVPL